MNIQPFMSLMSLMLIFIILIIPDSMVLSQSFEKSKPYEKRSNFSKEDWKDLIDEYWGDGYPTPVKLNIFDEIWDSINNDYDCFQNLDIDWEGLGNRYRQEINEGVSRGRFTGIINSLMRQLQETHVHLINKEINLNTALEPGVPIMSLATFFNNRHFGATLTPLSDGNLLVYKAFPDHPIGLVPGDIVLGYEGVPWKILYQNLLEAELPLEFGITGSTAEAWDHIYLSSAGLNWHLFDTIDIIKYTSGDTLHIATSFLAGQKGRITGSDQVPVNGIDFWQAEGIDVKARDTVNNFTWLDKDNDAEYLTWGILEKTNIGYLYVATLRNSMHPGFSTNIFNAVMNLINNNVDGLIFDLRFNNGGSWSAMDTVFSFLLNSDFITVKFFQRSNANDHFLMKEWLQLYGPNKGTNLMLVRADTSTSYDRPIAVLTGPGCVSAGDQVALKFKQYPAVRIFGKSTGGAFAAGQLPVPLDSSNDWLFAQPIANSTPFDDTTQFLAHTKLEVDEEIWLDPDSVAMGIDNVVSSAVNWIQSWAHVPSPKYLENNISVTSYPNPFKTEITINISLEKGGLLDVKIFDQAGKVIEVLNNNYRPQGTHEFKFIGNNLPNGIYYYRVSSNQSLANGKLVKFD